MKYHSHLIRDHENFPSQPTASAKGQRQISAEVPTTSDGRTADFQTATLVRFLNNVNNDSDDGEGDIRSTKATTMQQQKPQRIFPCHMCQSTWFASAEELALHREDVHKIPLIKRHRCNQCNASFDRAATLRDHLRRFHVPADIKRQRPKKVTISSPNLSLLKTPQRLYRSGRPPTVRKSKKFRATERDYEFSLSREGTRLARAGFGYEVLSNCIRHLTRPFSRRTGKMRVVISSEALDYPISVRPVQCKHFSPSLILNRVEQVMTSKKTFPGDAPLRMNVLHVSKPRYGAALRPHHVATAEAYVRRKRGCWDPRNTDYSCLGTCITAALEIRNSLNKDQWKKTRWYRNPPEKRPMFEAKVDHLYRAVSMLCKRTISRNVPQTHEDLLAFQNYLNNLTPNPLQLFVYEGWYQSNTHFIGRPYRSPQERLFMTHYNDHFALITDKKLFFNYNQLCAECCFAYRKDREHTCRGKCRLCFQYDCLKGTKRTDATRCEECQIIYCDPYCFRQAHTMVINGSSGLVPCQIQKRCYACGKICHRISPGCCAIKTHKCGQKKCRHCRTWVSMDHLCCSQKPAEKQARGPAKFLLVFFDYETIVENHRNEIRELKPFLTTALVFCECCIEAATWPEKCGTCGTKKHEFWNMDNFCRWLFFDLKKKIGENRNLIALAHNGSRFDNMFLLSYLIGRGIPPKVVFRGNQCLILRLGQKIIVKDFCTFVPAPLDALPAAFGFEDGAAKGFFPYLLLRNGKEALEYEYDTLPPKHYFDIGQRKSAKKLVEFNQWYAEETQRLSESGAKYILKNEALKYCHNDTKILAMAALKFRQSVLKMSNRTCDPLVGSSVTLASMVAQIYRAVFMPPSSIGIMPRHGYGSAHRKQSVLALKFLEFLNRERRKKGLCKILHAGNNPTGEIMVGQYKVDGVTSDRKEAYEIWYKEFFS